MTTTLQTPAWDEPLLGKFLRDRRAKIDPISLGFQSSRRRTPGLRREEVAQRAHISAAWYMCLEQGRGGAPSPDVLNNLAEALLLTEAEREHLFLIGLGRAPDTRYQQAQTLEPRLQRILDQLNPAPAFIKTATWDIVAWNRAATVLMPNLGRLRAKERNTLRLLFLDPESQSLYHDWPEVAKTAVSAFRADVARAGAMPEVASLVDELLRSSSQFRSMWQENDVSIAAHATKELLHPTLGQLTFEASAFGVDGRQDLTMLVFLPSSTEVANSIADLLNERW